MTLSDNQRPGSGHQRPRWPAGRAAQAMAGAAVTGVLALALAACGGSSGSSKIDLSVSSGPSGRWSTSAGMQGQAV